MSTAGIIGVGTYLPEEIRMNDWWIHNKLFFQHLPEKHRTDPFQKVRERRIADASMEPSDFEVIAGEKAIKNAGLNKEQIDLLLVHSFVSDRIVPLNASLVQYKLGLSRAAAWNMDTCCSSFVTMVITAASLIASGMFRRILIISSAIQLRIMDWNDYFSVVAGDGVGAVVMGPVDEKYGFKGFYCTSDGSLHDAITIEVRSPHYSQRKHYESSREQPFATFNNPDAIHRIGKESVYEMKKVMEGALANAGMSKTELDFMLTHQPASWATEVWAKAIGLEKEEQRHDTYSKYGNIAGASIPVNMEEAYSLGKLKKGMNLMLASSGVGVNHTACILRWSL